MEPTAMKLWAIFYRQTLEGSYADILGDRGLIRLDGRHSRENMHRAAREECSRRGFDGYRLARGHLLNLFYLTAAVQPVGHARPAASDAEAEKQSAEGHRVPLAG